MRQRKLPRLIPLLIRIRHCREATEILLGDLAEEMDSGGRPAGWFWRQAGSLMWRGGQTRKREGARGMPNGFDGFRNDIRYAARVLKNSPGTTVAAVLAIVLGIGANTGIFTLLNAFALRPLPVAGASDVVTIYQIFRGGKQRSVNGATPMFSYAEFQRYRAENHVFSGMAAYHPVSATLAGESPETLSGFVASCDSFSVLGRQPALGRGFRDEECRGDGAGSVVVLSDAAWRRLFHGDPKALGSTLVLNREHLTVVGVAPPGFVGTEPTSADFWAPLSMAGKLDRPGELADANLSWLMMLGRRKAGVSLEQVRADLALIAAEIDRLYPGRTTALDIHPATFFSNPSYRKFVLRVAAVILGAVGLVLLIACANVANLLLARASGRRKEIAIRLSVGASRGRLIRQLLTESVLLALAGGIAGSLLAFWGCSIAYTFLNGVLPANVPKLALNITPDLSVLGYALALTLGTGLVFGLAPALEASKTDLNTALKEEGPGGGVGRSRNWLRSVLVAVQVSVCMVLMIAAGLLARGLEAAQTVDPGFSTNGLVAASFDLVRQHYTAATAAAFHRKLVTRAAALPGVDAVAEARTTPLSGQSSSADIQFPNGLQPDNPQFNSVTPSYFATLGIPISRGRTFPRNRGSGGAPEAIVTEDTARRLWPGQEPLGKTFRRDSTTYTVTGVAKDSRTSGLAENDAYFFYFPIDPQEEARLNLLVHSRIAAAATAKAIRAAVREIDPNVIADVRPVEEDLESYRWPSRVVAGLSAALGALALLLSSIGIYGVVSYAVSRRVREIGIRVTLGADRAAVVRLMMGGAMRPVLTGAVIGVFACAAVSRILSSLLFGVSPLDPAAFGGTAAFLLGIAALASYMPARRAARVDAMAALRYE